MLMIIGFILIVATCVQGFMLYKQYKRPQENAEIIEIYMKKGVTARKNKEYPFAKIRYYHQSSLTEKEIALRTKAQVGDKIRVNFDPNNANDVDQYVPNKDKVLLLVMLCIGIALVVGSFLLIDILD